ncbi:Pyrimidine 5'-nucleotidase [Trichinella nativa]|uniref:5'-nucleotidase n=1 Tax=Trichinella nativa TaxID=6335 RepID=A0A1Y3EQW6_9BILA|nr:Pyrimidine 5'-nucleotidase [Trichinella nativa]
MSGYLSITSVAKSLCDSLTKNSSVIIPDPTLFCQKWITLKRAFPDKLQVVSDFDKTLSKYQLKNGDLAWSTHDVVEQSIFQTDKEIFAQTLKKALIFRWKSCHDLIVKSKTKASSLEAFTAKSKLILRREVSVFFDILQRNRIPFIIFSAGIGDVITYVLKRHLKSVPENVHLISNFFELNDEGIVCGFKEPMIHTFNKNASVIVDEGKCFYEKICNRDCVLLIGDSLGDVHMDVGVVTERCILKVGFLNENCEKLKQRYKSEYDVIICNDQTFRIPNHILQSMLHTTSGIVLTKFATLNGTVHLGICLASDCRVQCFCSGFACNFFSSMFVFLTEILTMCISKVVSIRNDRVDINCNTIGNDNKKWRCVHSDSVSQ